MKFIVAVAAAVSALAGPALAQPAWHPSEGGPPAAYPPCVRYHEDRCRPGWGYGERGYGYGYRRDGRYEGRRYWRYRHRHYDGGSYAAPYYGHSSTDGERG